MLHKKFFRFLTLPLLFAIITAIIFAKDDEVLFTLAQSDFTTDSTTLIIDPGHGGLDGGAVSASGQKESELNLAISQKLYDISRFFGLSAVLTRNSEEIDYPDETATIREKKRWDTTRRVSMVNEIPSSILISIHQNNYPDPRPSGYQVFYNRVPDSEVLANCAHMLLQQSLYPENRRLAAPISEKIYLMNHAKCPAILVECGFLSNPNEAAQLSESTYQRTIAAILFASYLQFLSCR